MKKYRVLAWFDVESERPFDTEECRLLLLKSLHKQPGGKRVGIDIQEHEVEKPHR